MKFGFFLSINFDFFQEILITTYFFITAGAQITRSDGNEILYQLTAVVTHLGATVEKGHYVADVYCKKAKDGPTWFHYNDSEVTKTQFQNVHRRALKDGYIFVYSKAETG